MTDFFLGGEGRLQPADAVAALILTDEGHYLMQLRDQKMGVFYPGHWGLFGGAKEPGEPSERAIRREISEELDLAIDKLSFLTKFTFDFPEVGRIVRTFYVTSIRTSDLGKVVLREGAGWDVFEAKDILNRPRIVPYDAFAIWLHANQAWNR